MIPDVESQIGPQAYRLLGDLVNQLHAKRHRNTVRADYYDMRNLFRDLGIAIPPNLRNLEVAMGWPAKAVDALARRVRLDGFVLPGGDVDAFGIPQILADNRMDVELPQAMTSSLIHSVAFIATTLGDVAAGEPEVLMSVYDARSATGTWDPVRRRLSSFLGVVRERDGQYERVVMLTTDAAYSMTLLDGNRWQVRALRHSLGRVPVEPLVYRPRLGRPFGSSRISRSVMSITDSAMRTVVRSEVGAEFFSAPQRYLLGADEDAFVAEDGTRKSTWDMVIGRILALDLLDEDGERIDPRELQIGQFPQVSMQPHAEHLRMWATLFAGETGLAVSQLGVVQDNPSSAEAIYAAKEDLVIEAEATGLGFTPALVRSAITGVQIRDGLTTPPPELRRLGVRWRDPSTPSRAAATDAVMKQIAAGVLPPESDVALEALGYDDTTIQRIQADRLRSAGRSAVAALRDARVARMADAG